MSLATARCLFGQPEQLLIMKSILSGVLTCEQRGGAESGRRRHCR
jgi:hypothetical protein